MRDKYSDYEKSTFWDLGLDLFLDVVMFAVKFSLLIIFVTFYTSYIIVNVFTDDDFQKYYCHLTIDERSE